MTTRTLHVGQATSSTAPPPTNRNDVAAAFAARREGKEGKQPQQAPAQQQAAPVERNNSQPAAEAAGHVEQPGSLTGLESPDELTAQGINSPQAHDRIREIGRSKNEAEQRALQAETEARVLRDILDRHPSLQPQGDERQEAARQIQIPEYDVPFPEDGSYEEQEEWRLQKRIDGVVNTKVQGELSKLIPALGQHLQPMMESFHAQEREAAWGKVSPALEQLGVDRKEIETEVTEMIRQMPGLSLEGAVYQAISMTGVNVADRVLARAQAQPAGSQPPAVAAPAGRSAPRQARDEGSDPRETLRQIAESAVKKGGRDGMVNLFEGMRETGMIRSS